MANLPKKAKLTNFFNSSTWNTDMQVDILEFTDFFPGCREVHGRIRVKLDQQYRDSQIPENIDPQFQSLTCEVDFIAAFSVEDGVLSITQFEISDFPDFKLLSPEIDHAVTDVEAEDFFMRHVNLSNDAYAVSVIANYVESM